MLFLISGKTGEFCWSRASVLSPYLPRILSFRPWAKYSMSKISALYANRSGSGRLRTSKIFQSPRANVTDLPIKFPGTDYRLPVELAQFSDVIQQCIDYEHAINPHIDDYYVYITVDQKKLDPGQGHRGRGPHSDGIQGRRIQPKEPSERTYIMSSTPAPATTKFYVQPFDVGDCKADTHNLTSLFRALADDAKAIYLPHRAIALADCYLVHEGPIVGTDHERTLLKVMPTRRKFDRLGNTHNWLFDYNWKTMPTPIPVHDLLPPPSHLLLPQIKVA